MLQFYKASLNVSQEAQKLCLWRVDGLLSNKAHVTSPAYYNFFPFSFFTHYYFSDLSPTIKCLYASFCHSLYFLENPGMTTRKGTS